MPSFGGVFTVTRDGTDGDPGIVEIACLEGELGDLLVLDRNDVDLVPIRLVARPIGVSRQNDTLLGQPFLQE